jgi:cysteine desulfurase
LDGVGASTGAACHSGSVELSPVLKAMEISPNIGMGAIRFSLGRTTTLQEIEEVLLLLKKALPPSNHPPSSLNSVPRSY